MAKEQTSMRLSRLTRRQLDELTSAAEMTATEANMLGVDRVWQAFSPAILNYSTPCACCAHTLQQCEAASYADWPQVDLVRC
ncbi:MAG: hypothetical protein M9896_19345 [Candidatus Promineofilum sp.]|uniref:hypothetical protein n=1 Tax=Promineifilum sp. TaxID=2664178 RepID=UPI002411A350|nr:hypothetical protein [Promineifilum sp.]